MPHNPDHIGKLEALLFIHGEPITLRDIGAALSLDEVHIEELVRAYAETLHGSERGLMLLQHGNKVQLVTKPEVSDVLRDFVKQELDNELTPASAETLAIITYLGPISKARIEYIRGVNSAIILRNLGLRGLVNRIPDPERSGGWVYESSFELFRHLGVSRREELPEFDALKNKFAKAEQAEGSPAVTAPEAAQ